MIARLARCLATLLGAAALLVVAPSCAGTKQAPDPAAELRIGIQETIADPARASSMLAAVDEIEAVVDDLDRLLADERTTLTALVRDHGSTRAELERSLAEFNSRRESLALRVLTAHAALKAEATAAEWKRLRKLEMNMITFGAAKSLGQTAPFARES